MSADRLIGVLSDTHGRLPAGVFDIFAGVEAILHAGDVGSAEVLSALETIAPVHAVAGNVDGWELDHLPQRLVVDLAPLRVGLAHGHLHGGPSDRHAALRGAFAADEVDLVIYGHTHRACCDTQAKPWVVNPGSASQGRGHGRSVALLHLRGGVPEVEIISIEP